MLLSFPRLSRLASRLIACCAFTLLCCVTATAGSPGSPFGRQFFIAFPDTIKPNLPSGGNFSPFVDDARIVIFSEMPATVTITAPGYSRTVTMSPGVSQSISLMERGNRAPEVFLDRPRTVVNTVFEVQADQEISITCHFITKNGSEAYSVLPVESWGQEYFAATRHNATIYNIWFANDEDMFEVSQRNAPSQIIIVAAEDGTQVTITTRAAIPVTSPHVVTLGRGQAYLLQSEIWAGDIFATDLSGTSITSNRPIGVITGNTRSASRDFARSDFWTPNPALNTITEWLEPTLAHGTTFVYYPLFSSMTPFDPSQAREIIRVYGTSPGTTVVTNVATGTTRSVAQGSYVEYSTPIVAFRGKPLALTTDKPAQAVVISGSFFLNLQEGAEDQFEMWSSAMSEIVPEQRWITFGRFHAPKSVSFIQHSVAIVAQENAVVMLDGNVVTMEPSPVPGTTFRTAWVAVPGGDHLLNSIGGSFTATAYGNTRGVETYRPGRAHSEGEGGSLAAAMHPTIYSESMSVSYAFPVLGRIEKTEQAMMIHGATFACLDSLGFVSVINSTEEPVQIVSMRLDDPSGSFTITPPALPFPLPQYTSHRIPVSFSPRASGDFTATVICSLRSADGTKDLGELRAPLTGRSRVVRVHIDRGYRVVSGDTISVPIMLDDSLDEQKISSFNLRIRYNGDLMRLVYRMTADMTRDTRLQGWRVVVQSASFDSVTLQITAPDSNTVLSGTGPLMVLRFLTFLSESDTSEVTFELTSADPICARMINTPGLVRLAICGVRYRFIEMGKVAFKLIGNTPNPFNPSTEIEFSLGLDGPTRLEIFNAAGDRVATLLDEHLDAGRYAVTWDASAHPSGLYYYRVVSGHWSRTGRMMLVK